MVGIIKHGFLTANLTLAAFPHQGFKPNRLPFLGFQVNAAIVKLALNAHKIVLARYALSGYVSSVMGESLKKKLKKWRKKRGLIQKQAADILGVNLRTLQGWEEGRPEPSPLALSELTRRMESAV